MPDHWSKTRVASTLLVAAIGFTVAFAACFILQVFSGFKTYFFLISGLVGSCISGGYIGFKYSRVSTPAMRVFVTMFSGLSVGAFVIYFSLAIILTVLGQA